MRGTKLADQIIKLMKDGEKTPKDMKLGVEIEHIVVNKKDYSSVTYYGDNGIEGLLKQLLAKGDGYQGVYEDGYVVGLKKEDIDITLEPGGQLEFSTRPCNKISYLQKNYEEFLEEIDPILKQKDQKLLGIGYHPVTRISEIPFNPKKRYQWMSKYLQSKGNCALNMMKGTAALQVTIDYMDAGDFSKKFRVANFLTPLLYLFSDNAPFFEGEFYEKQGLRAMIWENTDNDRSGVVPSAMNKRFTYSDYAEYLIEVPAICIKKEGVLESSGSKTIKEIYQSEEKIEKEEAEHLMTMVFPDVRCKNFIEIRAADAMPKKELFAYVAFLKGLFYNQESLNILYELSLDYSIEDVIKGKHEMMRMGFEGRYCGESFKELGSKFIGMSKCGLGSEERTLLEPLEERVRRGKTLSQELKEECKEDKIKGLQRLEIKPYHA